jgi:hypothetical protein
MDKMDREMAQIKALCDQLLKGEGDLTPEELTASFKLLGLNVRRMPVPKPKVKKTRRGIGSY